MTDLEAAIEAAARAMFDAGNTFGVEAWERITEDDRESYRESTRAVYDALAPLIRAQARAEVAEEIARDLEGYVGVTFSPKGCADIARRHAAPRES